MSTLQAKLEANQQRRARESYLQMLTSSLRSVVEKAPTVESPALDAILARLTPNALRERAANAPGGTKVYSGEYCSLARVFAELPSAPMQAGSRMAHFKPFGVTPLFVVELAWGYDHFRDLVSVTPFGSLLASTDETYGIAIDHYSGYLENTECDDIVFELLWWQ